MEIVAVLVVRVMSVDVLKVVEGIMDEIVDV